MGNARNIAFWVVLFLLILALFNLFGNGQSLALQAQVSSLRQLVSLRFFEPYFFDFAGDLYDREIEVAFHHFLRPEEKFDSVEALIAQTDADCARARAVLAGL